MLDQVVTWIAANRFPFPDQTDWPKSYQTLTNGRFRRFPVQGPHGAHYPDIVILNEAGVPCRLGEVEECVDDAAVARWRISSQAADRMNETGVKNLFVYVPRGMAAAALARLDAEQISFAGLREYVTEGHSIAVVPYITRGDRYDHQ